MKSKHKRSLKGLAIVLPLLLTILTCLVSLQYQDSLLWNESIHTEYLRNVKRQSLITVLDGTAYYAFPDGTVLIEEVNVTTH